MFNRIVIAGRIMASSQSQGAEIRTLEVSHTRWDGQIEPCQVAVVFLGRLQELAAKYLWVNRHVQVTGFLRCREGQLEVVGDEFEFLPDELTPRCLWTESSRSVA